MVDEMRRIGVPPVNPFYGGTDAPQRLAYYYLWHFSAAELSLLTHASGWEADAALTWFTAFASLMAMAGVARLLGGGRWTPLFVVILAASASARPVLYTLMGDDPVESIVGVRSGLAGWMFQAMWAPQHCAAAACLVLAVGALGPMVRTPSLVRSITVALLMAATFEASTWIGGIVLPLAVIPVAVALLIKTAPAGRMRTFAVLAATGVLAMLLIAPLFYDQIQAAMSRGTTLITFRPYEVLSSSVLVSQSGRVANLVAYWLLFLPVEFLASYVVGVLTLIFLLRRRASGASDEIWPYCILILASLISTWLFASTYGDNNDLGWRSVLPAASALIIFAAIGFEILIVTKRSVALVAACVLLLLTAPDSGILIYRNVVGHRSDSARIFAGTPALWEAVRKHAGITERVANNPEFLADLTPWDVNISWALLANRRSCYAGDALVGPFSALPEQRALAVQQQFDRIFSGNAEPEDLKALLTEYRCDAVVLTAEDPAWPHDPFATSSLYRLVDSASGWRIYRRAD
ncbi:MAG TPA: hypothetical protein VH206_03260 [Xanthobacteraceae bacterium]|nr:hypothetical protein [Xanthobacteraceae bacterium]